MFWFGGSSSYDRCPFWLKLVFHLVACFRFLRCFVSGAHAFSHNRFCFHRYFMLACHDHITFSFCQFSFDRPSPARSCCDQLRWAPIDLAWCTILCSGKCSLINLAIQQSCVLSFLAFCINHPLIIGLGNTHVVNRIGTFFIFAWSV